MSLAIAFKGPEGIVLAADSRVTLNVEMQTGNATAIIPATYDNASKMLKVAEQEFVGVITYGLGAIGKVEPRTAHSYVPEFESELKKAGRLKVKAFAKRLSEFFMKQWQNEMEPPEKYKGPPMAFLIGGYDPGDPYGQIYEIHIPTKPELTEQQKDVFGMVWGGQLEITSRILNGFDPGLLSSIKKFLKLPEDKAEELLEHLKPRFGLQIPYQFLPLQDCVDLAIFLVRATVALQSWQTGIRGVGGAIDVATITRQEGFRYIQRKEIVGERHSG